ncbi:hypothetical protein NQ315_007262 [Exocentrus adspersus]|uniref:Coiled-coil domain-containing protein 13 n=1 Tax=Exocentrus adspersus TaxID=1586481 RepID=A0AAV8WEA2_9CUCU|nr:hypothetical protein NQ315_007262 [Exocentrus adspersus]
MHSLDGSEYTLHIPENFDPSTINIPEVPDDIIFPDELNRYLREQIRYYVHENGMLQKNLADTEDKYNNCKRKVVDLESKLKYYENDNSDNKSVMHSTQVASLKIVELSKKIREKNAEVEALKTKNSKLQQVILELREKPNDEEDEKESEENPTKELQETVKKLEDKLSYTSTKLTEAKNTNFQLKNDLKLANKWLHQEIGESFESLQSLTNTNGGWRGRAQIIIDLQQKKQRLRTSQDKVSKSTINSVTSKSESKISLLSKENDELKTLYDELKKKHEAAKARCKVLENECILIKSKYNMVKEQSERDQDIITTLSAQISNTREMKKDILKERGAVINRIQKENDALAKQIEEYKATIRKIKEELQQSNIEMERLNSMKSCRECGDHHQKDQRLSRLEAERQKLLELAELQNSRLAAERDAHLKTQASLRQEKQRAARAEANAARIELESNTSRSSYSTASSSKQLEFTLKDQLELAEENVKALKTRLEIEQLERKSDLQEFAKALQSFEGKTDC